MQTLGGEVSKLCLHTLKDCPRSSLPPAYCSAKFATFTLPGSFTFSKAVSLCTPGSYTPQASALGFRFCETSLTSHSALAI